MITCNYVKIFKCILELNDYGIEINTYLKTRCIKCVCIA